MSRLAPHRLGPAALALSLTFLAPLAAQDAAQAGPIDKSIPGRNAALSDALSPVARGASRFVVAVRRGDSALGYGVLIGQGYVLTCASLLKGDGPYQVAGPAGSFSARVAGRHGGEDVALLRVEGDAPAAGIPFGQSGALAIGSFVLTVGTEERPLNVGVLSARDRQVEASEAEKNILLGLFSDGNEGPKRARPGVLQHDGALTPEQFGAPLVDRAGRLIGINVDAPYRGSSHAVGIDRIVPILDGLKAGSTPVEAPAAAPRRATGPGQAWLGVSALPAAPDKLPRIYGYGLEVRESEGPAQAAGVRVGDLIVLLDGKDFTDVEGFAGELARRKPGERVKLGLVREGKLLELEVVLAPRP